MLRVGLEEKRARPNDDQITLENTRGTTGDDYDLEDMSKMPTSTLLKAITDSAYQMLTTVNVLKTKEEKACEAERQSKEEISLKGELQRARSELKGTRSELEHVRQDPRGMNSAYRIMGNKYNKKRVSGKKFLSSAQGKDFVAYLREKIVSEYRASPAFEEEVMQRALTIYEDTIRECRRQLRETGLVSEEIVMMIEPDVLELDDDTSSCSGAS